jgi:hypothetical protein
MRLLPFNPPWPAITHPFGMTEGNQALPEFHPQMPDLASKGH